MNYVVSVIFRAIPLAMMAVCVAFGVHVWTAPDGTAGNFVAGRVVTFLGAICLCLFCTAATIIRQLIGCYGTLDRVIYPTIGYLAAARTAAYGGYLFVGASSIGPNDSPGQEYVAGHVVFGLGLISGCVATLATASTKFSLIPENSQSAEQPRRVPPAGLPGACRVCAGRHPRRAGARRMGLLDRQLGHDDHARNVHGGPRRRRSRLYLHEPHRIGAEHPPPGAKHTRPTGSDYLALACDPHGITQPHLGDRRGCLTQ